MNQSILPPASIGIIGGGQLGMMIIREAQRMGYRSVVWDPDPVCPASRLADATIAARFDDQDAAEKFAAASDVITFEFENVDLKIVELLSKRKPLHPGSEILRMSQHRFTEKNELRKRGIPVVPFSTADSSAEILAAIETLSFPVVVKKATMGYDGKGQAVLHSRMEAEEFVRGIGSNSQQYIVEQFIDLACELSVMVARGIDGTIRTFPVSRNLHRENILHTSVVPANVSSKISAKAEQLARELIESTEVVGLLGVEMFVTKQNEVLVNEIAPRPHNSGHYTLDACDINQFEMLVRCVCGLPLPQPLLLSPAIMINLLGKHLERLNIPQLLDIEGAKLHLYGKTRVEAKRKMGHITLVGETIAVLEERSRIVKALIGES